MASGVARLHYLDPILRRLQPGAHVRIFIPSQDREGRQLRSSVLQKFVENGLADVAGGATSMRGEGIYRNGNAELIREVVIVVESYLPDRVTTNQREALLRLIDELGSRAEQEALAVSVDGRLILVPSPL